MIARLYSQLRVVGDHKTTESDSDLYVDGGPGKVAESSVPFVGGQVFFFFDDQRGARAFGRHRGRSWSGSKKIRKRRVNNTCRD